MAFSFHVQFPDNTDRALCTHAPTTAKDAQRIIDFVHNQERLKKTTSVKALRKAKFHARKVLFIDIAPTEALISVVRSLSKEGFEIHIRDHHNFEGEATTRREKEIREGIKCLQRLLGHRSIISTRQKHPSCASLIEAGEFNDAVAIVTDADFDGWLGAMKAFGLIYNDLDKDANILDGPWTNLLSGSYLSQLLVKGSYCIAPCTADREVRANGMSNLFTTFAAASQGDHKALSNLESRLSSWQITVDTSNELADAATEIAPGAWLIDTMDKGNFDLGHLSNILENRPGCKMMIIKKFHGAVAEFHGSQYMIVLAPSEQKRLNLHTFLPAKVSASSPKEGACSNTSFALSLSPYLWEKVLPALRNYLNTSHLLEVEFGSKQKLSLSA